MYICINYHTVMRNLIILPEISDIKYFKSAGDCKSNNNDDNKIRENIIANIFNIDDEYINDNVYGEDWKTFREKFIYIVSSICDVPFEKITIKHMGGMTYNYDFILSFIDSNRNIIKCVNLEFKHNVSNIINLPQFMELYDNECKVKYKICDVSYGEFYYDNFIDNYLATDDNLTITKPTKNDYLSHVKDIKYKHEFFKILHNNKQNKIKEKKVIANESVKKYLEMYSDTFKFDGLSEKIKNSQINKVFLLWDCNNFHTKIPNLENLVITKIIKKENLYFDLDVENIEFNIRCRINWGNSNGLCNPRWKFTFIRKETKL